MAIAINGSSNTITGLAVGGLPDGVVDTDMLAANAVTAAKATGSAKGITMVDVWTLSSNYVYTNVNNNAIDFGFVQTGSYSAKFGNAMTESSGVFTFPETGIYEVVFESSYNGSTTSRYINHSIQKVISGTASGISTKYGSLDVDTSQSYYGTTHVRAFVDITNVTTDKVQFLINAPVAINLLTAHSSNFILSAFYFIRIGDT